MTVLINPGKKNNCTRKVKLFSGGFRLPGCTLGSADLYYDPDDPVYPFKTIEVQGMMGKKHKRQYDLKLKAPDTAEPQGFVGSILNFFANLTSSKNQ